MSDDQFGGSPHTSPAFEEAIRRENEAYRSLNERVAKSAYDDLKAQWAAQREELERLRNLEHAAVTLAREVRGAEAIEGPALRVALGNSNVSVLLHWADTVMACTPKSSTS